MADTAILTKGSSARRLLMASVRMYQSDEDHLATFVVASAAYATLRELLKKRGTSFQELAVRAAIFQDAELRLQGKEGKLPHHPELHKAISMIAEGIQEGSVSTPNDVKLALSHEDERTLIRHQVRPYNFLKHADRDHQASLSEGDVDARSVIIAGLSAYGLLFPSDKLPAEIEAFLRNEGVLN